MTTTAIAWAQSVWLAPLKRRKPTLYFVNSMGDLFHEDVPNEWIDRAFAVMGDCEQHKFIVLTKRAERMREYLAARRAARPFMVPIGGGLLSQHPFNSELKPPANVALGVSVEDQASADDRIPQLLATPAAIRMISAEPLLGAVDLKTIQTPDQGTIDVTRIVDRRFQNPLAFLPKLDWVIAGGESGASKVTGGSRPCHPDWARKLRDQCAAAGVPFFWKQWGDWAPGEIAGEYVNPNRAAKGLSLFDNQWSICWSEVDGHRDDEPDVYRIGKAKAAALLDGQLHRAAPEGWSA